MTGPQPLARVLVAFALVGAGLVDLGLVRGTFPHPQAVLALVVGAVELVAAVLVLRAVPWRTTSTTVLVQASVGGLVAVSVLGILLALAPGGHFGAAAAAAAALQLAAAATVGAMTRPRPSGPDRPAPGHGTTTHGRQPRRAGASLALLFVGAVVVSTITTAGLADTEAGARAVPHGEHHLPGLPGLEQHHHGP
ncbi:hypothetical protein GCM10009809_09470 [Isoptericola hypogeus]|uniref:Uncharacterized protein n=1 Tax=Isoptericola hypogeus TaxID=300179 RepID=A0ABN2J0N0_9MICO